MCSFNNKKSKQTITKLCANNQTFTDPMQISDCLNRYFCTIGNSLAHSLPNTDTQSFKKFLTKSNKGSMFISNIDCGVPQGSVLGLSCFLFIWMISNIVVEIVIFTCLLITQMFLLVFYH